ncbi:MAG: IS481 family transposase [Candidatus Limnocylindrales bacterium]
MSKNRVAVLKVVARQLSVTAAAAQYGMSRQHLQRLLRRYRQGGLNALEPGSRRPLTIPQRTSDAVRQRIVELRSELTSRGLDAGPVTIAWHLGGDGLRVPSSSTIRRVLHAAGLVTPEPRKRPRSSYVRFEAAQPNELWQSDFTHWRLADGTEVEIINWLDDHSRYLLGCHARRRVSGDDAVTTFLAAVEEHGTPAATLTDNGSVYTSRFTGGRNGFEYVLAQLGVRQKNGAPGHPQTQGKVERFHQTLKRWLACQPTASTLARLQVQLDRFRGDYNEHRPHRARGRLTPAQAYCATPKAEPATSAGAGHYRLRYDLTDRNGAFTLRRAGRLHHLKVGAMHARVRVLAIADDQHVTVVALATGEVLSIHVIEPGKGYWRNQQRDPGRWPRSQ